MNSILKNKFDVIYSTMTLQYLSEFKNVDRVISLIKRQTEMGGYNIVSVPTATKVAMEFPIYFSVDKLKGYYDDWKVLEIEEIEDKFTSGKIGTIAYIIAQKK